MKKYLMIIIFFYHSVASAINDPLCSSKLNIVITNLTPFTCRLIEQNIKQGMIASPDTIPTKILPGQISFSYTLYSPRSDGPDVLLSYQCGEKNFTTIESTVLTTTKFDSNFETDFWGRTIPTREIQTKHILGFIVSLSNLLVNFEVANENCAQNIPKTIEWFFAPSAY